MVEACLSTSAGLSTDAIPARRPHLGSEACSNICRQFNSGYYCQAPQTPTYNFSDPNFAAQAAAAAPASSPGATGAGRHLLQASNSTATNSTGALNNSTGNATVTCNRIAYYGNCGERSKAGSWLDTRLGCHQLP